MPLEWALCLRYLRSTRVEKALSFITTISVVGVTLGVAALVVAMAVMNGYRANLVRAMAGALPHLSVYAASSSEHPASPEQVSALLRELLPVESLSPFLLEDALVRGAPDAPEAIQGILLRGIDPPAESQVPAFVSFFNDGSADWERLDADTRQARAKALVAGLSRAAPDGRLPVLLSRGLAAKLGVGVGDTLTPLSLPQKGRGFAPVPYDGRLVVRGYLSTGIATFDELVAVTAIDHIRTLLEGDSRAPSIGVRLRDPLRSLGASATLREALFERGYGWSVYSWLESNRGLFQVINLQKAMLFIILMMIVVIAVFGMISGLIMLVAEKTKEIAVLQALGLTARAIRRVFLLQGVLIGITGTAAGMAVGLAICWALATFPVIDIPPGVYPGSDRLPVLVAVGDLLSVAGGAVLFALLATLYPSRKATALRPAEGLRYG